MLRSLQLFFQKGDFVLKSAFGELRHGLEVRAFDLALVGDVLDLDLFALETRLKTEAETESEIRSE